MPRSVAFDPVCPDLVGRSWVGRRGPRGLGHVFGKRFAAERYRSRLRGTEPNPHFPRTTANRPAPLQEGARSKGRGLRIWAASSLDWGFVGG